MTRAAFLLAFSAFPALADEDWNSHEILAVEDDGNGAAVVREGSAFFAYRTKAGMIVVAKA